jgi:(p)ppGpp synthase/HD superfamily hydrolase
MATIEQAILIATQAHQGQTDKAGAPYILHPLRLMLRMQTEAQRITAVLHDVVEDSDWTIGQLAEAGFAAEVLQALDCLTRRPDESYGDFIDRIKTNHLARQVKLADLEDNMNLMRIRQLTAKDLERLEKYHRAWQALHESIQNQI